MDVDKALERFLASAVAIVIHKVAERFQGFRVKIDAFFVLRYNYLVKKLAMLVKMEVILAL